jgi:hypothetical protein
MSSEEIARAQELAREWYRYKRSPQAGDENETPAQG